ncbi:MAG: Rieske 2Fe-2S domain-containing protein [Candidatus Binatia bacterium]
MSLANVTAAPWRPVSSSADVGGKPLPVRVGDEPVVLFRDGAGVVRALEDRCPHRRAPLSLGRVTEEGTLQCGYHGWCWDGASGLCARIPNLRSDERVPPGFVVRAYATEERDGEVFVRVDGNGAPVGAASEDLGKWRPGSFALRDAWFPVAHTPHVGARPILRQVHRQPYWLWRDGARIRATEFPPDELAAKRSQATELSDGTGEYPTIERYGYAWVWYGNPKNARAELMPDIPHLPREGKLPRHMWGSFTFHCTYELTCENLLDLTHTDFVHKGLIGDSLGQDDEISVESTSETVTMVRENKGRRTGLAQKFIATSSARQDFRGVTFIHLRSGVTILHGKYTPGLSVRLFHPNTPASREETSLNFTFNPRGANWVARNLFPLISPFVARQDDRMLAAQNPRYLEGSDRADFSSRFDAAALAYRKRMKQLVERQRRGDFSYQSDCDPGADIAKIIGVEREA